MANIFHDVFQLILNNLYLIGVLALSTMGITLTYKTTNVANFSQATTSTIGAYMAGLLVRDFGCDPWLAMAVGVLLCFVIGVLVDAVVVRHVGGGSGRTMVTIALIVIFTAGIPLVYGTIPYNFPRFFKEQIEFSLFGMQFNVTQNALFVLLLSAAMIALIFAALNLTKWGLGVRGTSSNVYVAAMMGVNTNMMTSLSWGISSACGRDPAGIPDSGHQPYHAGQCPGKLPAGLCAGRIHVVLRSCGGRGYHPCCPLSYGLHQWHLGKCSAVHCGYAGDPDQTGGAVRKIRPKEGVTPGEH